MVLRNNKKTGEPKELSKLHSALIVLVSIVPLTFAWAMLRFYILKTNDFICKYCRKEYGGISHFNVERLKLALLVEVAKVELVDCLGYFLGLVGIYQIDISKIEIGTKVVDKPQDLPFNELLLDFFAKTNDLHVERDERLYNSGKNEIIKDKTKNTYHE
ncbi:6195_t:CDS:2 [Funneliformis geosporum]|uniref:6195_t:CDS:1 n=1 Tax=Funneliformis geosporum TaxID=1117311 RepID=A0A9W4X1W0_9GLOM|nr:6195_t:CDS:2 [Funneliformis geosporum]